MMEMPATSFLERAGFGAREKFEVAPAGDHIALLVTQLVSATHSRNVFAAPVAGIGRGIDTTGTLVVASLDQPDEVTTVTPCGIPDKERCVDFIWSAYGKSLISSTPTQIMISNTVVSLVPAGVTVTDLGSTSLDSRYLLAALTPADSVKTQWGLIDLTTGNWRLLGEGLREPRWLRNGSLATITERGLQVWPAPSPEGFRDLTALPDPISYPNPPGPNQMDWRARNDSVLSQLLFDCKDAHGMGALCEATLELIDPTNMHLLQRIALPNSAIPHERFVTMTWMPAGDGVLISGLARADGAHTLYVDVATGRAYNLATIATDWVSLTTR
jgi:hypothetical protein